MCSMPFNVTPSFLIISLPLSKPDLTGSNIRPPS